MDVIAEQLLRARNKPNPAATALEKDTQRFKNLVKKNSEKNTLNEFAATASFTLLELWNKYINLVPKDVFNKQIISMGDLLFEKQDYATAKNLCYQWYLIHCVTVNHDGCNVKEKYFSNGFHSNGNISATVLTLKALTGDAVCSFYSIQCKDYKFIEPDHHSAVVKVLTQLRGVTQAGLYYEPLYWLVHNGIVHIYTIAQHLMMCNLSHMVVEYLLWAAVCMESSVPLMAVKFLSLRASIYTAICQCYYDINQGLQAELFARRGLDKVNELARMENMSSEETTDVSELTFRGSALKLGVMVFKRSVLESRTKNKSILRTKSKPTVKDSIQSCPWPRSPTEKLLSEMFNGRAAQFLAVLKALEDHSRRPLYQGPPNPKTELDQDTISDVYHELFCAGTELALSALDASTREQLEPGGENCLLQLAITGQDVLSVGAIEVFARLAYNYEQMEVFNMLLDPLDRCARQNIAYCHLSLLILTEVETLKQQIKATKDASGKPQIVQLLPLAKIIGQAIGKVNDLDVLLDASLLLWKHASQYYQHIVSCDLSNLRHHEHDQGHTLTPPLNFVQLLIATQSIFHQLELWKVDTVLYISVCLKLAFVFEGGAQGLYLSDTTSTVKYDRAKLLDSRAVVEAGLAAVNWARCDLSSTKEALELGMIHCELLYTYYRLQVKLASTHLPPPPPSTTTKPSMLKSKVKERQMIEENRKKVMASVTAPDDIVPSWADLVEQCANDQCCHMLLLMAQSSISTDGDNSAKERLVKEAEACLLAYQKQRRPQQSVITKASSQAIPPAPELIRYSGTHMVFKPSTFLPENVAEVCWYKLFGCRAIGSNVKVRLSDHHYPGLGNLVPATEPLVVTGLQSNEMYIFAVAAYGRDGKLIGGSIGDSSRPLVASHDMPVVVLWGLLAQYAYVCKVNSIALRAAENLRKHFVTDGQDSSLRMELLESYPTAIARLYLNAIFIHVAVSIEEGRLWCDQVTVAPSSLLSSQQTRLQLCAQLLTALEVGQHLNSPSHCLQIVVMSYGLLMPLLQYGLTTKSIAWVLMYCFSVLQEVPIQLLLHSQSHLHHMVAVISHNLAQLMLTWKEKNIFLNICEATKLLLLATLPMGSPTHPSSADQGSIPSVNHPLYQQIKGSVVLSEGNTTTGQGTQGGGAHNSLVTTLTTISSIMTSSVPTKKGGGVRQRKGRRNNTLGQDTITDEMKSDEMRAIEAFVLSNQGSSSLDDTELTGQEDINLLHTIINILPLTAAHKEVVKFHRRPHYLSLLVLLLQQAISEGNYDLVLEWSREARHWLNRRNDLLLTHNLHQQQRPVSALNKSMKKVPVAAKKSSNVDLSMNSQPNNKIQTAHSKAVIEAPSKHIQHQKRLTMHLAKIEITRDDLTVKARAVLKDRLTTLWKRICRRRKLREVLSNEMCWRAQFNLCQAVSSFQLLLGKLDKPQQLQNSFDHLVVSHNALRLDSAMIVISGVIPSQSWIPPPPPPPTTTEETGTQEEEPRVRPESARIEMKDTDSNLAVALGSSAALLYNRPPRPQSVKTDTPPLREKPKPPGLHWEMQECFVYYQRAIVLAHRKKAWTLLQNACRGLWNAINVFCDRLRYSNENDSTSPTLGTMYASSLSSLYFAVDNLLDMINELPVKLPTGHMATAPLHYTIDNDDTSSVDGNFIARLSLLSVHVFYANQHWEKLLHCGSRLLQVMSQYSEQVLPLLLYAQRRLKDRIAYYGPLIRNHALHPAAHLDPGPAGHNIYGSVGYALILTMFSTNPGQLLNGELMIPDAIPDYQRSVCHCRSLMARYLASTIPALTTTQRWHTVASADPPSRKITSVVEHPPISSDHLHTVVEAYSNAISCLEQSQLCGLKCELMNELGALLMHAGDIKLAAWWWEKALVTLVGVADPVVSAATTMESCGLWGCLSAGVLAARLAQLSDPRVAPTITLASIFCRCVYYNELDNHKRYIQMSAALLKVLLNGNISLPDKDIDFALYNINGLNLLPGLDVFSNPFRCNAHSIASAFQYVCEQLVHSNEQLIELLPLLTTYEYFSHCILCNVQHYIMSLILKVELLTQINMFSEALALLWQILTGDHLPVAGISATTTHRAPPKFDNAKQMSDQRNFRVLATVLDRALPPSLQRLYGEGLVQRVMLAQAGLLVSIASTNITVPHQNMLGRAGHCSRPGTTLSDYVPSASGHLTSEVPSSAETTSSTTTRCSKGKPPLCHEEIKLLLLEHSEQLICQLCSKLSTKMEAEPGCHHLWMLVRGHLLLSRVARLYHQPSTAVKICHNAIVLLQQHLQHAKSIVPTWGASPVIGTRVWLLCQLELLDSLTHCHVMPKGWGDCMAILEEGLKGTTVCGDDILADKMKLRGVLYFLKMGECSLLKRYLPHSSIQGQCNLTNLQTWLIMCDEVSHDPCTAYTQLEEMIIKMLTERTPSSENRQNAYQHELYLLQAHIGVQLSYKQLCQMERHPSDAVTRDDYKNITARLDRVVELCNLCDGGQCITLKGTALFCLGMAWHKVYAEGVMAAEPLHEVASNYIECLLTVQPASIAHMGLVVNCYLALAELFISKSKAVTQVSPVNSGLPPSRSGRSPDKDSKECYRDKIVAWNCVKAAATIKQSYLSLSTMTASLHKEDILKTLPDKALVDLPDFVMVELCGSTSPHQDPLPVESISPSRQSISSIELTWLPILNYHCSLHQQFTPTHGLLPNGLPTDVITVSSRCRNLHHFLSDHLPYYSKTCVIPGIPKVLIPYTISQQSAPSMTGSYTPVGEWEVIILWNTPVFGPSQVLDGIVSLHHKSSTQQQATVKVFTITVLSQELESLLSDWLQMGSQHEQTISDSRQGEKTSLKSKKRLKQISSGTELEELIAQQVNSLLVLLSGKNITDFVGKIPTVSVQNVPTIARLLQPLGQCTANGEDVYKLFYKLSELLL